MNDFNDEVLGGNEGDELNPMGPVMEGEEETDEEEMEDEDMAGSDSESESDEAGDE